MHAMSIRTHILLLVLLPLAVVAALVVTAQRIPVPEIGRAYVLRVDLPKAEAPGALPDVAGREGLQLVVIDAGHGGHDPGASGQGYREKTVVLGLARALRAELEKEGNVRVALTRDDDRYLVHAERGAEPRAHDLVGMVADGNGDRAGPPRLERPLGEQTQVVDQTFSTSFA